MVALRNLKRRPAKSDRRLSDEYPSIKAPEHAFCQEETAPIMKYPRHTLR